MRLKRVEICAFLCLITPVLCSGNSSLGLPKGMLPQGDVIELGRKLFFDRRLSINNTLSCGMCHIPEQGFTQNQLKTPVGLEGRVLKRNSPTLLNVGHQPYLFHDGREFSLVNQVWGPLLSKREMGNLSIGMVIKRLRELDDYAAEFEAVLGGIDAVTIGEALAAYQLSLNAGDSPFDRWFYKSDATAVSERVKNGFRLFKMKGCINCHQIEESWALFTDHWFHNTGLGYERSMKLKPGQRSIKLTDTVTIQTEANFEGEVQNDLGRYEVTGEPDDRWKYRTAGLRNVALTAPYMHDGSLPTLESVLGFYAKGGVPNPGLDPLLQPFSLSSRESKDLIEFLRSLTSSRFPELIESARQDIRQANITPAQSISHLSD